MLLNKCPNAIQIYDRVFDIETNARLWLNISIQLSKINSNDIYHGFKVIDILFSAIKNKEQIDESYNTKLIERLYWFLNCGKTNNELKAESERAGGGSSEKLYSFEKDDTLIFTAFYRTYKIDIEEELDTLHWWKFMAMFNDLDEKSKLVGVYMYYRGLDINESSIYKHASEKEKQKILEMKNFVSLDSVNVGSVITNEQEDEIRQERLKILEARKNGNGN